MLSFFRRKTPVQTLNSASVDPAEFKEAAGEALIADLINERRTERRWKHIKRFLLGGSTLILFGIYVFFYVTSLGYAIVPNSDIVGVVRVTGDIVQGSQTASADAVIPALSKAFSKPNVKAIVLYIDSGGGAPAEAERIYNYFNAKKKETGKPVYAVIANTGASAAYLIAMHADKVYAGKYSLVGSIGAIMNTWDFHKIAQRFEVQHKTYASGELKGMLDPWTPQTPAAEAKAQSLVVSIGERFAQEVKQRRGAALKPDYKYFTGEVWTGEQAFEIGLIDGVDTLDSLVKTTWKVGYHDFGPNKKSGGFGLPFSSAMGDWLVSLLMERQAAASQVTLR